MSLIRSLATPFVKSSLVAFFATLCLGRSTDLQAVGEADGTRAAAQAEAKSTLAPTAVPLKPGQSRVDALEIETKLVPDATKPSRVAVELVVHNPTSEEIDTRCEVALERFEGAAEARVSRPPTTVWRQNVELEVVAGATITRRIELPKQLGAHLENVRKSVARVGANLDEDMPRRYAGYEVFATPRQPRAPQRSAAASKPRAPAQVAENAGPEAAQRKVVAARL
jgi:hypothetical protein